MKRLEERLGILEEAHKKEISNQNVHINRLTSDIKDLKDEVETLQHFQSNVDRMRQTILDAESNPKINTPKEARNTRNALAHGGNLLADVEAVKKMEVANPMWKKTFDSLYDLNFDTDDVENLPDNLVKRCNMFVTIKLVTPWRDAAALEKTFVLSLCAGLISGWRASRGDGYWTDEVNKSTYDHIKT